MSWNGNRAAVVNAFGIQVCINYFTGRKKQAVLDLVFSR